MKPVGTRNIIDWAVIKHTPAQSARFQVGDPVVMNKKYIGTITDCFPFYGRWSYTVRFDDGIIRQTAIDVREEELELLGNNEQL